VLVRKADCNKVLRLRNKCYLLVVGPWVPFKHDPGACSKVVDLSDFQRMDFWRTTASLARCLPVPIDLRKRSIRNNPTEVDLLGLCLSNTPTLDQRQDRKSTS
jgi:hypothetical protein